MLKDWAEKEAEAIVDKFVADEGPDDLLRLQMAIAAALRKAKANEKGPAQQESQ
jgi:hypothetical protein